MMLIKGVADSIILPLLIISFACTAQTVNVPRDTKNYTLEGTEKKIKNNYPNLEVTAVISNPSNQIVVKKDMIFEMIGQRPLYTDLFYPKNPDKKYVPGILLIHGGGWRDGDRSLMIPMAERLAEEGYFVMTAEYRRTKEAVYPAAVLDLYGAVNWMTGHAKKYGINKNRLVIMGCSAGGQLATLVGTTYNHSPVFRELSGRKFKGKISAIVDVDGVLAFRHPDSSEGSMASEWLGGTYEESTDHWEQASALNHVDEHTPPTLFLASKYPRFLAGRQDYIKKLEACGTYSQTEFLEDAPHSFWLVNPWFEPTMKYVKEFLEKVLD